MDKPWCQYLIKSGLHEIKKSGTLTPLSTDAPPWSTLFYIYLDLVYVWKKCIRYKMVKLGSLEASIDNKNSASDKRIFVELLKWEFSLFDTCFLLYGFISWFTFSSTLTIRWRSGFSKTYLGLFVLYLWDNSF